MRVLAIALVAVTSCLCLARVRAQYPPPPDEPAAEAAPLEEAAPAAEATPAPEPAPAAQPEPAPQPYAEPAPASAQSTPPASGARFEGEAGYAYGDDYAAQRGDEGDGDGDGDGFEMPPFSIRLDPFSWLIEGRLGIEFEVGLWKFLSVEFVPVLVANSEPPTFNLSGREDSVSQESNGLGPFSGTSLGLGFWLDGEPFRGYVLRAIFTNYGYTYEASDSAGTFDRVKHTERQLVAFFGSYARWGFFTLGGGIGLGYELNQQERCFPEDIPSRTEFVDGVERVVAVARGCDELQIALDRNAVDLGDLYSFIHPVVLMGRFSLGVAFD